MTIPLKQTGSCCPTCLRACAGEVFETGQDPARVFLKRTCSDHGDFTHCISSDARFYWLANGSPEGIEGERARCGSATRNADLAGTHAARAVGDSFESLSTCIALIEIVRSCNLACPTCFADSQVGKIDAIPLDNIQSRVQGVIDRKGKIEILQLSGGEPTLHPEIFSLLDWAHAHDRIDYVLLNTNGIRIAKDDEFVRRLGQSFPVGGMQLYLQHDGVGATGHDVLRGVDLRELKQLALERCQAIDLPITLAMTVIPENLDSVWDTVDFALAYPHVRGVAFQPFFGSGRVPEAMRARLNVADIVLALVRLGAGQLKYEDFTPLPCGDPNCATVGYLLKTDAGIRSISDYVDFSEVQGFLKDRLTFSMEDLARCGCESEPLGHLLKEFESHASRTFRIFIKPFMDAHSWDQHRIDRCCTHVIRPDGALDSFCRYYAGSVDRTRTP